MSPAEQKCREHYGITKPAAEMTGGELTDWLIQIDADGGVHSKAWIIEEFRRRLANMPRKFKRRKAAAK